ncbi:MAG: hypothetical protein U0163_07310 [Gemmatimonadaceae bacterium]
MASPRSRKPTPPSTEAKSQSSKAGEYAERRTNRLLRMLIDEMLDQVRELQRHAGPWPAAERAAAEVQLERIMGQVRQEAIRNKPDAGAAP